MQDQFLKKINVGLPDANSMYYWILHLKGQKNIYEFTEKYIYGYRKIFQQYIVFTEKNRRKVVGIIQ